MSDPRTYLPNTGKNWAILDPWVAYPAVKDEPEVGVVEDVAKSGASGTARGGLGLLGLPGTATGWLRSAVDHATDQTIGRVVNYGKTGSFDAPEMVPTTQLMRNRSAFYIPGPDEVISGEHLIDAAASVALGIKYQPQTTAGEYARTVGEFAPGLLSPGTMAQKVVGGVLIPALASESLGQGARKVAPSLAPAARVVGALGGGLAGALASGPGKAAALSTGMHGVDEATVIAAGQLMQAAQARGIALTWPEAIVQASNGGGKGLINLQRFVEKSVGGGAVMDNFMARRPAQVEAAGRQALDTIAPQSQAPSTLGPTIGGAADDAIQEATGIIDRATSPAATATQQEALRQHYLEPLMAGPLGQLAKRDITTREAIKALFPAEPLAGALGKSWIRSGL